MKRGRDEHFTIEAINYETGNPVRIMITQGFIESIQELPELKNENLNLIVAPGLIDNQINGFSGVDFSGENLLVDDVIKATHAVWKEGVTSFLPTLITNSHENLIENLRILNTAISRNDQLRDSIPGFHLEGPYISPEEGFRGCHPVKHIRKPSWKEFMSYQEAASGKIIQVTLAPEIEDSMDFIRLCRSNGVLIALGHTNALASQIAEAVSLGARLSTHLGNGCANLIHRHKNPIWPQLANDQLTISIIADGQHLSPEEIKVFCKVKCPDNIILTSDIVSLAGMSPGKYMFLESEVILTEEGMLLNQELNCLAGASFSLKKGVENIMNFTGCPLSDAIKMASGNVASLYKFNDRGKLSPGRRADIILFEKEGNSLKINQTFLKGERVYKA